MRVVVDLQDRRSVWAMPTWVEGRLRAALPEGSELVMIDVPADGSGDGSARVDPRVLAAVEDADVYMGYGIPSEILRRGTRLRWVHTGAAGVGGSLTPEMRASPVLFTNSAGVHAVPMAETVMAMILHFARGVDLAVRVQAQGRWGSEDFYRGAVPVVELGRSTVGVVGFGGIGREVARRAAAFGARVLGLKRSAAGTGEVALEGGRAESGARAAHTGAVALRAGDRDGARAVVGRATVVHGPDGLARLLDESDYIVLTAPGTDETAGLIGRAELARMRPGAVLVNVSRGALVDEDALVEALREGRLRGAALDVVRTEPLSEGHPLWGLPNVLITPHVSAVSPAFWDRETDLIVGNLRRFAAGEPLVNLVDKRAGY